ncbi:MAG: SpoIID/LytB domain-containing protein [Elusimicrobiota bacterium]
MKKYSRYSLLLIFIIVLFSMINHNTWAKVPILRVGILLDCKEITISSEKKLNIHEIPSMKMLFVQEKVHPLKINAETHSIKVNNQQYPSIEGIKIIPEEGGLIQVGERKYRGEIEIVNNQGSFNVINIIEIEEYLYGVLKKEISPEWPEDVLKAQAIAARTFALFNINKYIDQGYNICATTNSQAYGGVYHEHPATNKAVNDTRGIIITYEGEPINAVYHSDSGGYTENSEDVWGGYIPYLRSVPSDYENNLSPPNHSWDCFITEQELLSKLDRQGFQITRIIDIVIAEKTESGRVKSVEIIGDNNQKITLKTNDFRLLIGPTLIRSSLFEIDKIGEKEEEIIPDNGKPDIPEQEIETSQKPVREILKEKKDFSISELINLLNRPREEKEPEKVSLPETEENHKSGDIIFAFIGQGNGHGVGLSQWGAHGMAAQGHNYEDILKYYYQGIRLTKLY